MTMGPTLLIGLGGTGLHMVSELRQRVSAGDPPVNQPDDLLRFLWIDTDSHPPYHRGSTPQLPRECSLNIGCFDARNFVRDACSRDPQFMEWWDCNDTITARMPASLENGSAIVRRLGRLGLYRYYSEVHNSLEKSILSIAQGRDGHRDVNVVIVSSLCGGTGSGTFFDIACMARSIQSHRSLRGALVGVFFLPEIYEQASPIGIALRYADVFRSNTYASLIEWIHYESTRDPYAFGPCQKRVTCEIDKALDNCWFIGSEDQRGRRCGDVKECFRAVSSELLSALTTSSLLQPGVNRFDLRWSLSVRELANKEEWKHAYEQVKLEEGRLSPHHDRRFPDWLCEATIA